MVYFYKEERVSWSTVRKSGNKAKHLFSNDVVKANARDSSLMKAWREHFNLTQKQLAEKSGMKQSALARIENSSTTPRRNTLLKLAEALGLNVEQLID